MTFIEALQVFIHKYSYASKCDWIFDPVAWALYHTWEEADLKRKKGS